MGLFSRFFGEKYDDERLMSHAQTAIREAPLIDDGTTVSVDSEDGVVTISGSVNREIEKERIEETVRTAIGNTGLKYERIENQVSIQ